MEPVVQQHDQTTTLSLTPNHRPEPAPTRNPVKHADTRDRRLTHAHRHPEHTQHISRDIKKPIGGSRFKGATDLSRAAWPHLVSSGSGRLILVSSSGILANPGASAYGAAKGAIWALGNTLAMEGDRVGVQVSTLMPTAWTPMTENAYSDPTILNTLRNGMGPEHVANFVTFLAHQDTAVHGDLYQVAGGRAGRMVLAGMPRVQSTTASPEGWIDVAQELTNDSRELTPYRVTGDQFTDEMIAANPAVAEAFANMNPADLGA